jgi:hypothetical protein
MDLHRPPLDTHGLLSEIDMGDSSDADADID